MPVARYFTLTPPQGMTIKLDSKGCATCQITVKNVSGAVIDGRALLVSQPPSASGAVEQRWITLVGTAERRFAIDQEEVFSMKIAVLQPKKGEPAPAGNYNFLLRLVNVARPDDSPDQSQVLGFTVAPSAPKPPSKLPLIAAAAALVLIIAVVTTWLLMRGTPVPDLTGKTTTEAFTILANAKLILDQNVEHVDSTPENSGKIVSQVPPAGKRAGSGSLVKVTLGAPMVSMPTLVGHTFAEAQTIANRSGLGPLNSTTVPSPVLSALGIVWDQKPTPGTNVRSGTAVSLKTTPQDVPVVSVINLTYQEAYTALQRGGLAVGTVQGDHNLRVQNQIPAGGMVPVGTHVNLVFQCTIWIGCLQVYNPAVAQQMYIDKSQMLNSTVIK
jgi:hypothetical protein